MDNNSEEQNQIHQNMSFHYSSKSDDLNTVQSIQSELIKKSVNLSKKIDEQCPLIEMKAQIQNTGESTKSESINADINLSQKTDEQSSLIEMNVTDQNTEYNTKQVNSVKQNKLWKILIFMFICFLLGCLIQYSISQNEVIFSKTQDKISKYMYKMSTLMKGKNNKFQLNYFLKIGQESKDAYLYSASQKQQSKFNLKFDSILNKFVVIKEYFGQKDLFEKEFTVLEQLKYTNITLDLVSTMQGDDTFEQIAGKYNLNGLKKKMKDDYQTYGLLYFKLLDKLNQMHEKGIAHSDIKPQHLVISFDNEPFFIDFGASISLSDENEFKNYLHYFTPEFNLQVYFEIFNPKDNIYKSIQFSSKEQIKLCDMTQLSLTFLYLLCRTDQQQSLFFSKKYNELLENLSENQNKCLSDQTQNSKMIVLHNISRILNQADTKINIVNEGKDQQFLNDEALLQDALERQNDVFIKDNTYIVRYIDKFSILFIYYYDQQGYNLEIDPQNVFITILLEMKEYQYISKKYRIDEYFKDLENSKIDLNDQNLFNIFEYVKIQDIKRLNIDIQFLYYEFLYQLQNSKLKDTLDELNIKFYFNDQLISNLIQVLSQTPNFQIQHLKISELQMIKFRIVREASKSQTIPDINIIAKEINYLDKNLKKEIQSLKNNFKIKEFDINIRYNFFNDYKILQDIKEEIEQINQEQKYQLSIQFDVPYKNKDNMKIEQFITEILNIKETRQTILIKFKNYNFNDIKIWQQIKNIMENKNNFSIEILIFNGKFNKQVAQMLQSIQLISDKVKYLFEDEYIQKNEEEYFCQGYLSNHGNNKELQREYYSANVKYCSQPQNQQSLKIVFYNKFTQNEQIQNIFLQKSNDKLNKSNKKVLLSNKLYQVQKDFYEYKSINELKSLKIQLEQQIYIQTFKFINRKVEIEDNLKDIDLIIKQIQNNNHYSEIKILNKFSKKVDFIFKDQKKTNIEIYLDSNDVAKLNQFKQLYAALSNNYDSFKLKEKEWDLPVFYYEIKTNQTIKYQSYNIKQKIYYQSYTEKTNNENIFIFLSKNSNKLQQSINKRNSLAFDFDLPDLDKPYNATYYDEKKKENNEKKFVLVSWSIELEDKTLYKNNQIEQISEIFSNNTFKDNVEHFENNSILNSILPTQIIKNQLLLQLDFESQYIGDNSLNILFISMEKKFPQSKMYNFIDCGLTGIALHNIFETVKIQQLENKLYLDLTKNNISYSEFKEFISKFDVNGEIKNYAFKIQYNVLELKQDLPNSIGDIKEIKESDFLFLSEVEKQSSTHTEEKRIQIVLDFNHYIDRAAISECSRDTFFSGNNRLQENLYRLLQTRSIFLVQDKYTEQTEDTNQKNNIDQIHNNLYNNNQFNNSIWMGDEEEDWINLGNDSMNQELLDVNSLKELIEPKIQNE